MDRTTVAGPSPASRARRDPKRSGQVGRRRAGVPVAAPGAGDHRFWHVHWELISCGFGGHVLVGTDAQEVVSPDDDLVVREVPPLRWHRCLRCDAWTVLPPPALAGRERVPRPDEIELPLRGRPLRDRFVLRLIALEKVVHVIVVGLLAAGVLLFAAHRRSLKGDYTRILNDFQAGLGGPAAQHHGILADLDKLFSLSQATLYAIAIGLMVYGGLLVAEVVGLWWAKRWAEYLAFVETIIFVPYEIYELTSSVSALKLIALATNIVILLYLSLVHRLFGIRGGPVVDDDTVGWPAIRDATPAGRPV